MSLTNTLDQVKALTQHYQSVLDLVAALEGLASIEQATNEANTALSKARSEQEASMQSLAVVNEQLAEANTKRAEAVDAKIAALSQARTEAADIVAKAEAEAAAIQAKQAEASDNAYSIINDAIARRDEVIGEMNRAQGELEALVQKIADTKAAALQQLQ